MSRRTPRPRLSSLEKRAARRDDNSRTLSDLRSRLAEAEETLRAIQSGEVDAVVVKGPQGERVFTLRGAEYGYRALVEAMNEGAATIAADGTILYCNGKIASFLGLPPGSVIGKPATSLVAERDRDAFSGLFLRALAGDACKAEINLQNSSEVPVYVSLSRLPQDEVAAVCMVVTDLREHKQRDELIAAGKLAQSILEHAAEAIAVCNADGHIILANEALRRLCGRNPQFERFDDVLPLEMTLPEEKTRSRFSVSLALKGNTIRAREVVYRRRGEAVKWLLLTAGPMGSDDHVLGCVLTLMDITKRKAAEHALLRSEKLAATGQLAATIAHEINNPLTAIYNLLFLIEQQPDGKEVRTLAAEAVRELSRVSHITKQTLAFYRETNGPECLRLREVLDDIVALFRKDLQAHKITVRTSYQIAGEIQGYPGEMRQIFSNLIRNAMEAVPEGGLIRLHLRRSRHQRRDGIGVFIIDNGPGIPNEIRSHIFEPFYTTKGQKGTGLGLWVARDLIVKHGGFIQLAGRGPGARPGACFFVFLPSATDASKALTHAATAD